MSIAAATILRLFREAGNGFVSGELISRELKLSRTAVWKHINGLRDAGYKVEAIPSRGYHLLSSPDILSLDEVRERLSTMCVGRQLICLAETGSTNAEAFRLAEGGAGEGTTVIADAQSGGKGAPGAGLVIAGRCQPVLLGGAATGNHAPRGAAADLPLRGCRRPGH